MLNAALFTILSSDPAVSTLVADRIYPVLAPQGGSMPDIVVHEVITRHYEGQDGPCRFVRTIIRLDCWAETHAEAKAVGTAARSALQGFSGQIADTTIASITLGAGSTRTDHDEEAGLYRHAIELVIYHSAW